MNYSKIKASIENWSHRDDIVALIDDFIDMAEADIWNRLRIRDMEARATATASGRYLVLPDYFVEMRRLRLISGSTHYELRPRSIDALIISDSSGIPSAYSVTSQLEFDKTPSGSYTIEMQYYKSLLPLDDTNTSNAVSANYPQLYVYGALHYLYTWSEELDKAALYKQYFNNLVIEINAKDSKARTGPAPAMRFEGMTP